MIKYMRAFEKNKRKVYIVSVCCYVFRHCD